MTNQIEEKTNPLVFIKTPTEIDSRQLRPDNFPAREQPMILPPQATTMTKTTIAQDLPSFN